MVLFVKIIKSECKIRNNERKKRMRKPRYYYESNFCHVMVQGDEKKFIFKDNICKDKYLYYLRHNTFKNDIEIIAYCVMDHHVHALLFCNE